MDYCKETDHIKVYAVVRVANCFPPQINWVCNVCGITGVDPVPLENYTEYDIVMMEFSKGITNGN